jgi:AraC-like DNA-binding protein
MTVKVIMHAVGFRDKRGFERQFKRAFGMSPSEYRRVKKAEAERQSTET